CRWSRPSKRRIRCPARSASRFFTVRPRKQRLQVRRQSAAVPSPRLRPNKGAAKEMRFVLGFIGFVFAAMLLVSLITGLSTYIHNPPAPLAAEEFHLKPKALHLASDGAFGKFDREQLQRGFQVYSEVCSACHSLKLV